MVLRSIWMGHMTGEADSCRSLTIVFKSATRKRQLSKDEHGDIVKASSRTVIRTTQ